MRKEVDTLDTFLIVIKTTNKIVQSKNITYKSTLFNILEQQVII